MTRSKGTAKVGPVVHRRDLTVALKDCGVTQAQQRCIMRACERVRLQRLLDENTTAQEELCRAVTAPLIGDPIDNLKVRDKQIAELTRLGRQGERLFRRLNPEIGMSELPSAPTSEVTPEPGFASSDSEPPTKRAVPHPER
jgi:hypothetical protein